MPHDPRNSVNRREETQRVEAVRNATSKYESPHVDRDYLRPDEANALIDAAGRAGRQPLRDQVLVRLIYRHGLRASEAKHTQWTDFDLSPGSTAKTFHIRRLKGSQDSVHTLDRDEVAALRKLAQENTSPFVFAEVRTWRWSVVRSAPGPRRPIGRLQMVRAPSDVRRTFSSIFSNTPRYASLLLR
jgi:type 1 fimbriae regulatory protein FimB/type 1 fimbriae regulatory protein FimE